MGALYPVRVQEKREGNVVAPAEDVGAVAAPAPREDISEPAGALLPGLGLQRSLRRAASWPDSADLNVSASERTEACDAVHLLERGANERAFTVLCRPGTRGQIEACD